MQAVKFPKATHNYLQYMRNQFANELIGKRHLNALEYTCSSSQWEAYRNMLKGVIRRSKIGNKPRIFNAEEIKLILEDCKSRPLCVAFTFADLY